MKQIIILGAGIGGLYVAKTLAAKDFHVIIFEKRDKKDLGYPWFDSISKNALDGLDINLPDGALKPKQVLKMHSPSGDGVIKQPDRANKDYDIDRKALIECLIKDAEKSCEIFFNTEVDELVYEDRKVVGVRLGSTIIKADLVVDSTGVYSKYRLSTPNSFLLNDKLKDDDYFKVKRAYFKGGDNSLSQDPNVYLFPLGLGIAWCKEAVNSNAIDILSGNFANLNKKQYDDTLSFLRKNNPKLSKELIYEIDATIPVRFPLGVLAGDGYALIGDSAFMTRPICGSGIEATLQSAKHLANLIVKSKEFTQESLWEYSVWYMFKYGSMFTMQYVIRFLGQHIPSGDIDWAFTCGILNEGNVALATLDKNNIKKFDYKDIGKTIELSKEKPELVKRFKDMFVMAAKAETLALTIPLKFDYVSVKKWKEKYTKFMYNLL